MKNIQFNDIDWKLCNQKLAKLQQKLTVAYINNDFTKVISIQNTIVHSFWARALAVKKVITNRGKNTPGVDKEIWSTEKERSEAIIDLKFKDYKAKPLKIIYTPGGKRPRYIPCVFDRAMQALHALALDPIAEAMSDIRSYGFRKYKSCDDATTYCHNILNGKFRARYILEGVIKGCFENLSHEWILKNVPLNKNILKEFLKAGFIESNNFYKTDSGVPQGGVISPIIANIVLTGLEKKIKDLFKNYSHYKFGNPKANFVRYADDFIVTASSPELFKEKIIPAIEEFLEERGLALNKTKTKITPIEEGFDFLGVTFRNFRDKGRKSGLITLSSPSRNSVLKLKDNIRKTVRSLKKTNASALINKLNPIIRGWANYFAGTCAKSTFTSIDHYLYQVLWRWANRKHPRLRKKIIKGYYFRTVKGRDWIFYAKKKDGESIDLITMAKIPIRRHIICLDKNPYLLENEEYYKNRAIREIKDHYGKVVEKLLTKQNGLCLVCETAIKLNEEFDIHHIKPKKKGGTNQIKNLLVLHTVCHKHITFTKNPELIARYEKLGFTRNSE